MFGIYYGKAKGKTCVCIGAAFRAAIKDKKVLFASFLNDDVLSKKNTFEVFPNVTEIKASVDIDASDEKSSESKTLAQKTIAEFFDNAIRMSLTFKYDMLILDGVFDALNGGYLSQSEVYEFLSNAPDNIEIICTGVSVDKRFLELSKFAINLVDEKKKADAVSALGEDLQ